MELSKAMLCLLLFMSAFTGVGILHLAQITGLVRVQVSIEPSQWQEEFRLPKK